MIRKCLQLNRWIWKPDKWSDEYSAEQPQGGKEFTWLLPIVLMRGITGKICEIYQVYTKFEIWSN